MFSKKFIFIKLLNLLVINFNDRFSVMKISKIFIFQIGNAGVIKNLPIYEILKMFSKIDCLIPFTEINIFESLS